MMFRQSPKIRLEILYSIHSAELSYSPQLISCECYHECSNFPRQSPVYQLSFVHGLRSLAVRLGVWLEIRTLHRLTHFRNHLHNALATAEISVGSDHHDLTHNARKSFTTLTSNHRLIDPLIIDNMQQRRLRLLHRVRKSPNDSEFLIATVGQDEEYSAEFHVDESLPPTFG
ncbi:hypothetical protein BDR05DRAFT_231232 [Suillus weaverae]|nr:hypothetical protein BDR05DRAFT_231232 [Suillus weaverae]